MTRNRFTVLSLALVSALVFGPVLQVTEAAGKADVKKEVIKLLKAEVGEKVILAYIKKTGVPEKLEADDIVDLKKAGAAPALLLALMGGHVAEEFPFKLDENHEVTKPTVHGPMAIYPILRKGPVAVGVYLTLDEATEKKVITIAEKSEGSVPVVTIHNTAKLPIYISAGEIIIGGKQDRMIAYDVIIQPSKNITVEVRCVEQGRWSGKRGRFLTANAMGNRKSRVAVQFKDQTAVWREVRAQNAAVSVQPRTGTYKATLTNPEVQKLSKEYAEAILPQLAGRHMVGIVVAINGEVHAVEMYGSPGLFAKMKEKLLKAYVLDIIGVKDAGATPPGKEKILTFYTDTMKEQKKELKAYEKNVNFYRMSPDASNNDCFDRAGNLLRRQVLKK